MSKAPILTSAPLDYYSHLKPSQIKVTTQGTIIANIMPHSDCVPWMWNLAISSWTDPLGAVCADKKACVFLGNVLPRTISRLLTRTWPAVPGQEQLFGWPDSGGLSRAWSELSPPFNGDFNPVTWLARCAMPIEFIQVNYSKNSGSDLASVVRRLRTRHNSCDDSDWLFLAPQ